jgi:fatty-acyl-CoA synthase
MATDPIPPAERRAQLAARYPEWTPLTLPRALDAAVEDFGERPFVVTDERTRTYAEIAQWSRALAAGLVELGVAPGDRVAMMMANSAEFVAAKFAIARAGAICIPVNYMYRAPELSYVLRQSGARVLITMDAYGVLDHLAALDELAPGWEAAGGGTAYPELSHVVVFSPAGAVREGAMTLDALPGLASDATRSQVLAREAAADPDDHVDILYTSGTTGSPKGVLLTHQHILRVGYGAAYHRAMRDGIRQCFPLPMYHVFGYVECTIASMFVGGAIVPRATFGAADMLSAIARHGVTEIVAVPAVTLPLLAEARANDYDLSGVTSVFSSGGAAPLSIWDDIRGVFGDVELTTGYGMTETTAATTCTLPEDPPARLQTTLGRLRDAGVAGDADLGGHLAVYKTVDPHTEADLPVGEVGHLLVRGPGVTPGYYDKPEETAAAFTQDGWLRTGDLGTMDADGYLRLTGRLKETFRCGGEMVMPKEIELVLEQHPAVLAAHVVGIKHERMGEIGCAWVILQDDAAEPEKAELVDLCTQRLARFKVPRHVFFATLGDLPLTPTGRVQKFKLSEISERRLQEESALR